MARILVIDDEDGLRRLIRLMLETEGHEVLEAASGKPGMQTQRANPAELVITDLIMPEQEGIETIVQLRREFPGTKILAISGGGKIGAEEYLILAKELGAHRALRKPFTREELIGVVGDLLKK